ncbi:polymorphic toxin-type HINT domain-containing protein [Streptomyces anulatus]
MYTPDDREFTGITLRSAKGPGVLTATDHHPFWTPEKKSWTDAGSLKVGDSLLSPDGTFSKISQIRRWQELQPAYNLTVADLHTYYVIAGTTPVLVHNCNGRDPVNGGIDDKTSIGLMQPTARMPLLPILHHGGASSHIKTLEQDRVWHTTPARVYS